MSVTAQELRPDFVSITVAGGANVQYTSAQAKAAGSVAAARTEFAAQCRKAFAGRIDARSIYLGIAPDYAFTALETVSASAPGAPPPLRSISADTLKNLTVTAWDGTQTLIPATGIAAAKDPQAYLAQQIGVAGSSDATADYQVSASVGPTKAIASLSIDGQPISLAPVVAPVDPATPQLPLTGGLS
jgi:hypothetical protein